MQVVRSHSHFAITLMAFAGSVASAAAQTLAPSDVPPRPHLKGQAAASKAQGQSPPANPAIQVQQILVTANKRLETQRKVANSVTAITGKTLDQRQEVNLQDLAAEVAGLSLQTNQKSQVRIVLRGLNSGSAGATVASLLDDVPINPTSAQGDDEFITPNLDTFDLRRIEVLKGPQSTLYGATAEGGLINYITNPPALNVYSGAFEGSADGVTSGGVGGTLKGYVNLPIIKDQLALRVTAWDDYIPGYIDNPEAGKTNSNSGQQYGWRASLLWLPIPRLHIRLTAERQSLFSNDIDYVQVHGDALTPSVPAGNQLSLVNGLTNNSPRPSPSQNESAVYYANVGYDFNFGTLTSITSYVHNNLTSLTDVTNQNAIPGVALGSFLGSEVYGVPTALSEPLEQGADKFNQEVRLTSAPGTEAFGHRLDWLGGVYYTHETTGFEENFNALNANDLNQVLTSPEPAGSVDNFGQLSEWAFFGQADYFFLPNLDLALGGRWTGNAQHSQTIDLPGVLSKAAVTTYLPEQYSNSHDALYSVAPRWRPTDNTTLYARIATGYRPGGPNIPPIGVTSVPTFSPDRVVNYEIGWRQDLFNKRVSLDITGFYVNWHDIQVVQIVNTAAGPDGIIGNAASATSKGVEWDLAWVPLSGLTLEVLGDYTDARLTADAPTLGGANGDFLPYVPVYSGSFNADYDWKINDKLSAYVSGTWSFVGTRFSDFAPPGGVTQNHVPLESYNTGSLRAGLTRGHYNIEAYVDNISNSLAYTFYSNQGGADETGQAAVIEPRTVGLVLRAGF